MIGGWLREHFGDRASLLGVGHRVVHGGIDYAAPVRVDPAVLAKLEALCPLAPLHQPHNLAGIRAVAAVQPDLPQVACFDTAFHRGHPELADWFALPRRFYDEGIRRYGPHGRPTKARPNDEPGRHPEARSRCRPTPARGQRRVFERADSGAGLDFALHWIAAWCPRRICTAGSSIA